MGSELCKNILPKEKLSKSLIKLEQGIESMIKKYAVNPNKSHFLELGKYAEYWSTIFPSRLCFACLLAPCDIFLPCGHALCEMCFRNASTTITDDDNLTVPSGVMSSKQCLFCGRSWEQFEAILPPPTASARILALDGGGVKGIVELEILTQIEQKIGLGLPIYNFFDLMVGTSTGNVLFILFFTNMSDLIRWYNCYRFRLKKMASSALQREIRFLSLKHFYTTEKLAGSDGNMVENLEQSSENLKKRCDLRFCWHRKCIDTNLWSRYFDV